jgi:hypothetical protein
LKIFQKNKNKPPFSRRSVCYQAIKQKSDFTLFHL